MVYQNVQFEHKGIGFNQHQYAHAAMNLEDGAIGVGEEHTSRHGRDFAVRLIETGLVRNLFLECDSSKQPDLDWAVKSSNQEQIKTVVNDSGPMYFSSGVELGEVATSALRKGAGVHFIDLDRENNTPARVVLRDIHAAGRFREVTRETGTAGGLVLYGAVHLTRGAPWYRNQRDRCLGQLIGLTSFIVL